jgi:hypothetical protein
MAAMNPRRTKETPDDEPTGKKAAVDDERTQTNLTEKYSISIDYTGEFSKGTVDHDDRGQARWKWNTETTPSGEADRTFDLLKALTNDALSIEGSVEEPAEPPRQSGYNPYDVGGDKPKPKPTPKPTTNK